MNFDKLAERISNVDKRRLEQLSLSCRADIINMTTLANSGHPGGSMSSIDILLALYAVANINPDNIYNPERDRIIISHGHISPAVYSCLASYNFIPKDDMISYFRKASSIYEGHIERAVPGVEWTTGNLGQGLSAASGFAIGGRTHNQEFDIYCLMGDGEQEKGQITEARRFIKKYGFNNITVIIDYNRLQISGDIKKVMPSLDIASEFRADGFLVIEIDGHNYDDIFSALLKAKSANSPVAIIANTTMGKGVDFMENQHCYHGAPLNEQQYQEAMAYLGLEPTLDELKEKRSQFMPQSLPPQKKLPIDIALGTPKTYDKDVLTDNRSAFGAALENLVELNLNSTTPIVVFDCDLAVSVKTAQIEKKHPNLFYQSGIAEHHTATCAGAASINGVIPFFADFGMFGVDEVYNQHRLNAINETNLKVATTHVGIDVGEDGKTHMCVDYIGLMRNIFNFKIIVPADPNETDRVIRFATSEFGNVLIAMGRSKIPVITDENGNPLFADNYQFECGKPTIVRNGDYPIFTYGVMVHRALKVHEILAQKGISVAVINVATPAYIKNGYYEEYLKNGIAFTYEDHISNTGLFSTLALKIVQNNLRCNLFPYGVNRFPCSGKPDEVLKLLKLDPESVALDIENAIKSK